MSLFIGNLSKHIERDELERVFRRFGHCNVNLKKEGYGFVVFDFPADAVKALRALKGRNICGKLLNLTWSNKQRKSHFPEFDRGGRRSANELQRTRVFDRLGDVRRREGFNGWRDHKMGNAGRSKSVDVPGKEIGYHQDDFKDYKEQEKDHGAEKDHRDEKDRGGDFPDEGGGVAPHQEDNGRYDEPTQDLSVDHGNRHAMEFNRYEPYSGYDRKHVIEDYSGGSPAANSRENVCRTQVHTNDSKFQQSCYGCRETGHKMQTCQKQHSPRRKYSNWNVEQDNKIHRKHGFEDENKLRSSGNTLLMRHQRDKRWVSGTRHNRAPLRNEPSPITKETDRYHRKEYGGRKRSRNETESPKRSMVKISRRSISSSLPSEYSTSQSPKSFSRSTSHSRSRSVSSRAHSSSSKLRSSSKSQNCRGKSLRSTGSSSPTSLPVSLNQPLLSSPNKVRLNSKSLTINGTPLESVDRSHGQQIGCTMELENLQSKSTGIAVNGQAAVSTTVVDAMEKDQTVQEDNNGYSILLNSSDGKTNLTKSIVAGNLSPKIQIEAGGFWHSGTLMMGDIPTEIQKPTSDTHVDPHSGLSPIISTDEICMVLNNYDLALPKDYEKNLTTDAFFGAARLWPWHIIYYRRLKKGPISTDNYARRVAQNQEFGIVDKYIRSSSGWGEFSLENQSLIANSATGDAPR